MLKDLGLKVAMPQRTAFATVDHIVSTPTNAPSRSAIRWRTQ